MSEQITILKKLCIYIFSILSLFSCRNRNQNTHKDIFKITLIARVLENDKFQVFYINEKNNGYSADNRIMTPVYKSERFQKITFLLNTVPLKFRIDLGENLHESAIEINKVILDYGDKQIEIDSNVLHRFFDPNIYIEKSDNHYIRKIIEKRYDPFISSTALLDKKLELEF